MLTVPAIIADLEPAPAVLPRDLRVCSLADDVAVESEARRLRGTVPARPTTSVKFAARAFRLFLTIHQRHEPIPRAFANDVLAAALGVDTDLRRTKSRMVVASEAGSARREGRRLQLASVQGVRERMAFNYLAEPEVAALAAMVETEGSLHGLRSPVADPERLAGQLVAHIRAEGRVFDEVKQVAWQMMGAVMLARGRVSELMVVALGMVLGVIQPDGEASREHLETLLGTRALKNYRDAAQTDGESRSRTGRWSRDLGIDKTIGRWRSSTPYRRLAAIFR